jgi:UDP-N-acetyl-D-galactosamine dehydrogenase
MGEFIANKVVKLMIQKNHTIKGARVLVLGITFKENCPDLRNSKVIDVIMELKEFGIEVDVFDSQADKNEVVHEYSISLINELVENSYHGIIHAVAHKEFTAFDLKKLLIEQGVIYDVKSILPKSSVDGRL